MKSLKNGIRFECQKSGECCRSRGIYVYVYLSLRDRRRIARRLDMPTREFTRQYTEKTDDAFHLKHADQDCLFLKRNRCSIHDARPMQCETWPFWVENLKGDIWNSEIAKNCEGVGKGRLYSADEIKKIAKKQDRHLY
ncbi:hypothetical protein MNBD_NITROSPINAE02-2243 [hydrothermal vent metagenome]|uniref:YkgJ family cysteine cluster protein n=1 Tax=hydrothermal vent metagenome TaxID=652676 RepID=A0A3B1CBU4_9ZZZZ